MSFRKNKITGFILCLFILLPSTLVNAAHIINSNLLEFSLSVTRQDTHYNFSSNTYKVKSNQLGINWYEPFSQYFHAGLELGYIEMTKADNTLASAQFTSGEYAGLLLRFLPIDNPSMSLTFNLNYHYNRTQGNSINQETQFAWHETLLFTEFQFSPTENIQLMLAAEYQFLNGEQRDSGSITRITPFEETEQLGYRFGVNFITNRTGVIGLEWFTGFRSGSRLYLTRKF